MRNRNSAVVFAIAVLLCAMLHGTCHSARVLLVVTEQYETPAVTGAPDGVYAASDLVSAGLPFDVRTYGRFLSADLSPYDVIILTGHTSPAPVADVEQKCLQAQAAGKKIFINGNLPYKYYSTSGGLLEDRFYAQSLFGVTKDRLTGVTGQTQIPAWLQKDAALTAYGIRGKVVQPYILPSPPPVEIRLAGKLVGFLGPNGGIIDSGTSYLLSIIDYGKLVNYLRNGSGTIAGFANDRTEGKPIASWEVHCHGPGIMSGANALLDLSSAESVPLDICMVYKGIDSTAISKWNSVTSPLIARGSHSRNHPQDWRTVTDVLYETTQALVDQRALIPGTINYLTFSGSMNPTAAQIDQMYLAGTPFGSSGPVPRTCLAPDDSYPVVQQMPTNRWWVHELAKCQYSTFWPAQTMRNDYGVRLENLNFDETIAQDYAWNVKYGLYNYTFIHDTQLDPTKPNYVNGVHQGVQIRNAAHWLNQQGVQFMFTHELVARLQDYVKGDITCSSNPDGSATVTATRPGSLINEIKIGWKDGLAPVATGESIISQRLAGECLYVTLRPETASTVQVNWVQTPPVAPVVSSTFSYISSDSEVKWEEPIHPSGVVEFQYAIGTTSGGTEILDWRSAGTTTSTTFSGVSLLHGSTCYVSVKARYSGTDWSPTGVSGPLVVDLTPAVCKVTDGGDRQTSTSHLNAEWSANDPDSGILESMYAIGTEPGCDDFQHWAPTSSSTLGITGDRHLQVDRMYYVTVRVKNGAGSWTESSSDGIHIDDVDKLGVVLGYPDNVPLTISHLVVSAVFPDRIYVQDTGRAAGVGVSGISICVNEGDVLTLDGKLQSNGQERILVADSATITGHSWVKPLYMRNLSVGGGTRDSVPGPDGGIGLNNIGLLIKVSGKVTEIGQDYLGLDDGSLPRAGTADSSIKVRVSSVPSNVHVGSHVLATGISAVEGGANGLKRLMLTRRADDLVVVLP